MENSSRFFANKACRYYPCHEGLEEFNCLFCYCPFYLKERCPGYPTFWNRKGKIIKDCTACVFPHRTGNYDKVIDFIRKENEQRTFSEEIVKKAKPVPD